MHHIAIMKKSWQLIPKILSGQKTIESRWYQTKRTPWNKISAGDKIFFKNSGEDITVEANVTKVLQFILNSEQDIQNIINKYGKKICLVNTDINSWKQLPKYCILIFLTNPKIITKPFKINKTGFGSATAWITTTNIQLIKI